MQSDLMKLCPFLFACALVPAVALADPSPAAQETVRTQFQQSIPNLPGTTLTAVVVSYPPGVQSPSHRHAGSAFIYAYVLSGEIRSQIEGEVAKIYREGESWYEAPGAHHTVSGNASNSREATLLAVFVAASHETEMTTPDQP